VCVKVTREIDSTYAYTKTLSLSYADDSAVVVVDGGLVGITNIYCF